MDSLPIDHLVASNNHNPSYDDDIDSGCDPMAIDIAVRVAFIQFMLSPGLLGSLRPYLRCLRLFPKPVVAQQKIFFLRMLVREQGKQGISFLKQLVSAQVSGWMHGVGKLLLCTLLVCACMCAVDGFVLMSWCTVQ